MLPVDREGSLADWLAHAGGAVGFVISDIVGSTELTVQKGTENYSRSRRAHHSRADLIAARLGGRVVEKERDELTALFQSATGAYRFACELFQDAGDPDIHVRVGVHFGTVRVDDVGLIGRNIILAARIVQASDRGLPDRALWVSDAAKGALERESPEFASSINWITSEERQLKGIPDRHRLWRAA